MREFIGKIFIIWRVNLEFWRWVGGKILPARENFLGPTPWANFDGVHYLSIAKNGYFQFEQAFFPLYPLLIRWLGKLLGGNFVFAGLLISNISLFFILVIFWKLLKKIKIKEETIKWTLAFLLFFPTSFYFGSIYTESLFMLLVFLTFFTTALYSTVVFASLASATKLVGAFLLAPIGLFAYMVYLWRTYGDPLMFIHAQPAFGANRSGGEIILLPQVLWRYFKIFTTVSYDNYDFWIALIEVIFLISVLVLLWIAWRKNLPKSWILFSLAAVIAPTLTGTLSSMPRYVLIAFPIYVVLAKFSRKWRYLLLVTCYLLLVRAFCKA